MIRTYGDYLKARGRLNAEYATVGARGIERVETLDVDEDSDMPASVLHVEHTPDDEALMNQIGGKLIMLNRQLFSLPEYYGRLAAWYVCLLGPCSSDEWTPSPPVQREQAALEAACTGDLRAAVTAWCVESSLEIGGTGGGYGGWDVALCGSTLKKCQRIVRAFSRRFADEIRDGKLEAMIWSRFDSDMELPLLEDC